MIESGRGVTEIFRGTLATNRVARQLRFAANASLLVGLSVASAVHAACPKEPAHYRVGSNAFYCTHPNIQAAIDAAGACPAIIEVTREHLYSGAYCNPNQPNGCHLSLSGKSVTLQGRADGETCYALTQCIPGPNCPAPASTSTLVTLDGGDNGRVISISGASNVTLRNLTITHGDAGGGSGGGIQFTGSGNLNITRSTLSRNQAAYGAAISVSASAQLNLRLQADTLVLSNTAATSGGGIRIEGQARLFAVADRTLISLNSATSGYGGGIEILGPARADIGSPGYGGAGVVSNNTAVHGAGIAVVDNGNGAAALRTFASAAQQPTEIEFNGGAAEGGGIYVAGSAHACLMATRVANNVAEEGSAIYTSCTRPGSGTCVDDSGTYVNDGWQANFGTDCGPESVVSLGGKTTCAGNKDCTGIDDNATEHPDGSPAAGATVWGGPIHMHHFHMRGNVARNGFYTGSAYLGRCLIADNSFSWYVMYGVNDLAVEACTIAGNVIDQPYVFQWEFGKNTRLFSDIIDAPGHAAVYWTGYFPDGILDVSYSMVSSLSGLPTNNPSIVVGVPAYVDAASGDYHLAAISQKALDFGGGLGVSDLDGKNPFIDLPKADFLGAADLGAYERQNMFDCGTYDSLFCSTFER